MRDVRILAVLGAGDMGHGIAELAALKGLEVRLRDVDAAALERAREAIRASLDRLVEKRRATRDEADVALRHVRFTTDLEEAVGLADLVVEAVPERLDLKRVVFAEAEALAPPDATLATNTSAIRVREIGRDLRDPSRLVGMHFFNPVMVMDLVEVVPSPQSSPGAVAAVEALARRLGKTVVTLRRDAPGFVTTRLLGAWVAGALLAHDHKLADREAIDAAMRHRAGFPMGPFELADYTGLDVTLHAADYLANRLGEAYRPSETLRGLVERGMLGRKAGRGFHEWREARVASPPPAARAQEFDPALLMALVVNEALKLLDQGVASAREIDLAMRQGCAFPRGPFEWADEAGAGAVLKALVTLEERTGHPLAAPAETLLEMVEEGRLDGFRDLGAFLASPAAASAPAPSALAPAPTPGFETLLLEVDAAARVGIVRLHRPHRLHALNGALLGELREALRRLDADEAVRVVLLTATGEKAFCAGADLAEAAGASPAQMERLSREGHALCLEMEKMGKPVVAALNGLALGGGLELALAADFRLAARRAVFALPEVTLGLLPAMGGTLRLPRLLGLARAKEIAMLGERFDAETALAWGIVHRVLPNEAFEQEARAFAARLATRAPLALRFTKQLLHAAPTTDLLAGMEAEAAAFGVLSATQDAREGVERALAKKEPSFTGR